LSNKKRPKKDRAADDDLPTKDDKHEVCGRALDADALSVAVKVQRYTEDGLLEINNDAAEQALRAAALGRKNFLFAGSDCGGERAATMYPLIGSAKLNGLATSGTVSDDVWAATLFDLATPSRR
jgi:hypothetical protein